MQIVIHPGKIMRLEATASACAVRPKSSSASISMLATHPECESQVTRR